MSSTEDYHKNWKYDYYSVEAIIDRSLWEDSLIENFGKKLNLTLNEIFKETKFTASKKYYILSIFFSGEKKIIKLNKTYRNINKPTNVLSFPHLTKNSKHENFLGDVIFSSETIANEANQENKSIENHLTHLFVHAVLHLLGYDHETNDKAFIMENLEIKILKSLNIDNPYK